MIGRVVHFEGVSETIIGVLPPLRDLFPDTDVWPKHTVRPSWPYMKWRGNKFLRVMGEPKPGVTPAMAEEDLTTILQRVPEEPRDARVHLFRSNGIWSETSVCRCWLLFARRRLSWWSPVLMWPRFCWRGR